MSIKENVLRIRKNINAACLRSQRNPDAVQIMAVCKDQEPEKIAAAIACGITLLGENRVQEAESHLPAFADRELSWHFIGRLQKNKINRILKLFQLIESVDSIKNLEHIQKRIDLPVSVFLEVNVGNETSKAGFTVAGLKKALPYIAGLRGLRINGLMTMPPLFNDPEEARPYFRSLAELGREINNMGLERINIDHLSMGMSADYEVAVEEGATIVRIGSALFGRRRP